jgi:hypothetical protein
MDELKEHKRYWNLKEEALARILCKTRFRRGYGLVARQTKQRI